jgi:hypothetical protein
MSATGQPRPLPGPPDNEAELQSTAAERVRQYLSRATAYGLPARNTMQAAAAAVRAAFGRN